MYNLEMKKEKKKKLHMSLVYLGHRQYTIAKTYKIQDYMIAYETHNICITFQRPIPRVKKSTGYYSTHVALINIFPTFDTIRNLTMLHYSLGK